MLPRREPDGRSSVVREQDPLGGLYCLNARLSDFKDRSWMQPDTVNRVRILEGVAAGDRTTADSVSTWPPSLAPRRILGEIELPRDGSFYIDVPANVPIELQTLDEHGMALRSCGWIWAKNHEPRGCIGCHEDGELTPENFFVNAMTMLSSTGLGVIAATYEATPAIASASST